MKIQEKKKIGQDEVHCLNVKANQKEVVVKYSVQLSVVAADGHTGAQMESTDSCLSVVGFRKTSPALHCLPRGKMPTGWQK